MLLLLQPSAAQAKQLDSLLEAQSTPGKPGYHKWITPAQFASQFAVSPTDAAKVASWLRAQGLTVAPLPASRGWIEFSGTVGQVQTAFGAPVVVAGQGEAGQVRYQLKGTIQLPAEISGLVNGLVSLDGSLSSAASTVPVAIGEGSTASKLAAETSIAKAQQLTPALFANWLQSASLQANGASGSAETGAGETGAGETGAGETIAIPARSNVREEDFDAFRKTFGLPAATLSVSLPGDDPGRTGDEFSTIQAVSWAGVAAPQAHILLIPAATTNATDGIDLALAAAIDGVGGTVAHTVSVGYTACESSMSAAHQAFYAALFRQAAAEGIAVIVASGDSGAAACHSPEDATPISSGWGVNGLASTPWNTVVGAVEFTSGSTSSASTLSAWQPGSAADAKYATGGGASSVYPTPAWQSAAGLPASDPAFGESQRVTHHRYLPDVSLPTAITGSANGNSSRGLVFCYSGESASNEGNGCRFMSGGGSAASAAIFSGIAALLAQKYGPQGNLAPNLYALSHRSSASSGAANEQTFIDVTTGSAKLPCAPGSSDCVIAADGSSEIGFSAGQGFDLASGLGSVNVQGLIANWASPDAVGTSPVTVEMTNVAGVTYNPSSIITLGAKVLSGSGGAVPTGTVQFYDITVGENTGSPVTLDSSGNASYSEEGQFSQGGHSIEALYSGDSTYESATSIPVVIQVQPSPTNTTMTTSSSTPAAGSSFTVTGTVVGTNPGNSLPSGTLTVNLDGLPQGTATLTTSGNVMSGGVSSASVVVTAPTVGGGHAIQGIYSGDINYNSSTSPSITITVTKTATVTSISAIPSTLTPGVPETFTAVVAPLAPVTGVSYNITGTVSFYDGGVTLLGTATVSGNTAILASITLSATAAHTITAVYSGDTTFEPSTSAPLILQPILLPVTVVLTTTNTILAPGQSANLTATVTPVNTPVSTAEQHPTGTVYFYAGTVLLGSATLVASIGDSSTATLAVPVLPAGEYVLTAVYGGDTTYGQATSNSLSLQVEDFSISCSPSTTSVVQGQSVSIPCIVASLGGLTGAIQLACAEQNPPQVGAMGCTFLPTVVTGNGTATLTVTTTAGNISLSALGVRRERGGHSRPTPPFWQAASGGAVLALAGLLLWPWGGTSHRARRLRHRGRHHWMALALMFAGMAAAGMGCSNSVTAKDSGTPLGVHTIKITAAADLTPPTVTVSHYAYVTINVTVPPAD
jgi:hypothetical protein